MRTHATVTHDRPTWLATAAACMGLFMAAPAWAGGETPGDDCFNALPAVVGANGPVNTATMTPSADPPANGPCAALNWGSSRDAWWVFDARVAGNLTVELCDSDFDTSVVIYQGSCGALARIGCDDDSCAPSGPLFQSRISALPVAAGAVYIRVGGYAAQTGNVRFNLAFAAAGSTECWGNNDYGQCTVPAGIGAVTSVAVGGFHTVAIKADGSVACWGGNFYGQCDIPAGIGAVTSVVAGVNHTVAIKADGSIVCWGWNNRGQCNVPAGIGAVTSVAAGLNHTVAIKADGSVACWGSNDWGQCNVPAGIGAVTSVAAGDRHTVAIKANGSVVCWGNNSWGQCNVPAGLGTVTRVAASSLHNVAIKANGSVACWGDNDYGQCNVPAGLSAVTSVAVGGRHTVAITANGSVVCWGDNTFGQCSTPSSVRTAAVIGAGFYYTVAVEVHDCDRNAIPDRLEIAARDCDANGVHDCWDAETGSIEDCNSNGLGDRCEKTLQVLANSGHLGPIGAAHNQTFVVANAAPALEPDRVTVRVTARGDFSGGLEYLRVRIGTTFDVQALGGTVDCGAGTPTQSFTMNAADFNAAIDADGALRVRLEPSIAVDWNLCPEGTWAEVELSYLGAQSSDCNLNGVLDSCELADGLSPDTNHNGVVDSCEAAFTPCAADFDGNGIVNGADLGALLGSWGPVTAGIPVDLSGDGMVNGADLGIVLGAWGPCAN